jgi:hypothetical protein
MIQAALLQDQVRLFGLELDSLDIESRLVTYIAYRPTGTPTSSPTMNIKNYATNTQYVYYKNYMSGVVPSAAVRYGNFYYKGLNVAGECKDWSFFLQTSLSPPYDNVYFNSINADIFTYDYVSRKTSYTNVSCNDVKVVKNVVQNILEKKYYAANCNGNSWRTFPCGSSNVLCLNCKPYCLKTTSCPGISSSINSCGIFDNGKPCDYKASASSIFTFG